MRGQMTAQVERASRRPLPTLKALGKAVPNYVRLVEEMERRQALLDSGVWLAKAPRKGAKPLEIPVGELAWKHLHHILKIKIGKARAATPLDSTVVETLATQARFDRILWHLLTEANRRRIASQEGVPVAGWTRTYHERFVAAYMAQELAE